MELSTRAVQKARWEVLHEHADTKSQVNIPYAQNRTDNLSESLDLVQAKAFLTDGEIHRCPISISGTAERHEKRLCRRPL